MDGSQIKRRLRNYLPNLPGDIFKIAIMLIFIFHLLDDYHRL